MGALIDSSGLEGTIDEEYFRDFDFDKHRPQPEGGYASDEIARLARFTESNMWLLGSGHPGGIQGYEGSDSSQFKSMGDAEIENLKVICGYCHQAKQIE